MAVYVIGDLHGYLADYRRLLIHQGLCDSNDRWTGGQHQLWVMGDFFDRGLAGVECVALTMALQAQAEAEGGLVNGILGNHELMVLFAHRFRHAATASGLSAIELWQRWGGQTEELDRLTREQIDWLAHLPAMHRIDNTLLVHADAMFYVEHGKTIEAVNASFVRLCGSSDQGLWESTLSRFAEREAFSGLSMTGTQRAGQLLRYYGAEQLVHGHTPIPLARRVPAAEVTSAWTYADGQCVNVDGGIYMGGPGFVHELSTGIESF